MSDFEAYIGELDTLADDLEQIAESLGTDDEKAALATLNTAIHDIHSAWSGSNLGYHARVYYLDLLSPPPNEVFSKEWGLMFGGGDNPWTMYSESDVRRAILERGGDVDVAELQAKSDKARALTFEKKEALTSILASALALAADPYLEKLSKEVQDTSAPGALSFAREYLPSGTQMSRDSTAIDQGLMVAPHQQLSAELRAMEAPFKCAQVLARSAKSAASHLRRRPAAVPPMASTTQLGSRVFIGHGRSPQWRELKEFLQDRLGLQADEFNRVPVAGTTTVARLSQMLDHATFACLIMTAEDELADGGVAARANVIHEVGLFQGRLGFERAIVLLEEGCQEFSNITGLSQLRYPANRISAVYEDLRQVLEREGLL